MGRGLGQGEYAALSHVPSVRADEALLVVGKGGQLLSGVEGDDLDPVGVEYGLQVPVLHGTVPQFGLDDVRDHDSGAFEDDLEHPEPLTTGEVTQRAGIEDVHPRVFGHEVTAQISASGTAGRSGNASSSKVPSSSPRARSTVIDSFRYRRRTACS